jgi:hypothetical protein
VFAGPIQESPTRKNLGGKGDAGIEGLFGKEKVDFDNKSNFMPVLSAKKADKKWKPKNTSKTAEQRKNE